MKLTKKNTYLLLGFIAMLLLSYHLAIKKTLGARKIFIDNLTKKEVISNQPLQLAVLSQKEKALNQKLDSLNIGTSSTQNRLLKFLNQEAVTTKVRVIDFSTPHLVKADNGITETYILKLEGPYTSILKILNTIENMGGVGTVSHLNFEKKKDYHSKRIYLQAQIFLEQRR
ncbi:MAG: hypothetical protein AB3N14_03225 [Flavobacteriaceae bacterium]